MGCPLMHAVMPVYSDRSCSGSEISQTSEKHSRTSFRFLFFSFRSDPREVIGYHDLDEPQDLELFQRKLWGGEGARGHVLGKRACFFFFACVHFSTFHISLFTFVSPIIQLEKFSVTSSPHFGPVVVRGEQLSKVLLTWALFLFFSFFSSVGGSPLCRS